MLMFKIRLDLDIFYTLINTVVHSQGALKQL